MAAISALPDRERRHLLQFYLAPKMAYGSRLGLAVTLIAAAFLIQVLWTPRGAGPVLLVSAPLLFAGNLFLLARGFNLAPKGLLVGGEWEKTTREQFRQAMLKDGQVRRWDENAVDISCKLGGFLFLLLIAAIAVTTLMIGGSGRAGQHFAPLFAADALLLFLPHWFTGIRRGWRPIVLREVIRSLETALSTIDEYEEPTCQIQPMFKVAGTGERKTPNDARVFIRFPDASEEFLGLQIQVSLNDVQGTKYPYLYVVLVAKKEFGLLDHVDTVLRHARGITVESDREEDVDVIVIRRPTTKTSGYHTKPKWIRRITQVAWESVGEILDPSPERSSPW